MTVRDLAHTTSQASSVTGDLCVVGAGIAGLLLAIRVARGGRKVIVLESGKRKFDSEIQSMNAVVDPTARYGRDLSGRFRGLGGTSSRWGGENDTPEPTGYRRKATSGHASLAAQYGAS